jgi:hypothetical protein
MSVVLLAEVKTHLNVTVTTSDTELQTFIDSAEATLTNRVGPLAPTSATARLCGGVSALALPITPVVSLTSVTPADGGAALTLTDLHLETGSGLVTYNANRAFTARYYDVVYSAGRSTCPEDLKMAVKELVRHLWASQRGTGVRPGSPQSEPVAGAGYLLPYRVQELLAPHLQHALA